jgi:hypothetical protein
MVVAVPISIIAAGTGYSWTTATALTIRSLPTCLGSSIRMFSPVFTPGPITITSWLRIFSIERFTVPVTGGTTEEIIPPSRPSVRMP